jgi:hypothetical protein
MNPKPQSPSFNTVKLISSVALHATHPQPHMQKYAVFASFSNKHQASYYSTKEASLKAMPATMCPRLDGGVHRTERPVHGASWYRF